VKIREEFTRYDALLCKNVENEKEASRNLIECLIKFSSYFHQCMALKISLKSNTYRAKKLNLSSNLARTDLVSDLNAQNIEDLTSHKDRSKG